jgi:hypothetical protein
MVKTFFLFSFIFNIRIYYSIKFWIYSLLPWRLATSLSFFFLTNKIKKKKERVGGDQFAKERVKQKAKINY